MSALTFLGGFPQVAVALALAFACALAIGFVLLWLILGLVTRESYNVTDASHNAPALVLSDRAGARAGSDGSGRGGATGGPYLLPAAAPPNRFVRVPKYFIVTRGRVVRFPHRSGASVEERWNRDQRGGAA